MDLMNITGDEQMRATINKTMTIDINMKEVRVLRDVLGDWLDLEADDRYDDGKAQLSSDLWSILSKTLHNDSLL